MPQHPQAPADPNQLIFQELVQAIQQQQQHAQQQPRAVTGILEPGQEGVADALRNPSQAQRNAILAGILGTALPNSRAPLLSGAATGLSALQQQRARDLSALQEAHAQRTEALQQRIENIVRVGNMSSSIQSGQRDEVRLGLERQQFAQDQREFQESVRQADREFQLSIAKERDIFEDQVGTDQYGNPVTAQFARNPITGETVQLSGGVSSTTPARRTEVRELSTKGARALQEGASLFFDPKLNQIFGITEVRPLIGGLTEGRIAGDAKALQGRYDRFVQERILDVARVLAPVTDVDVRQLKATLAPQKTLGSAEEARAWFTQQFAPKVLSEARMKGSPVAGLQIGEQFVTEGLRSGMTVQEAVNMLGYMPFVDEVMGFEGSPQTVYTPFDKSDPLHGRAIPASVIQQMAKQRGLSLQEFIQRANMQEVTSGQR